MQNKGVLYLIPNSISESDNWVYPDLKSAIISSGRFLVETPKVARRWIKKIDPSMELEKLEMFVYDKKTSSEEIKELLEPLKQGISICIITDSGQPGIADPGSNAVFIAQKWNIKVKPFVGPSSIFLALAASGLNGQQFNFHGYLPINQNEVISKIRKLELESRKSGVTQIFIETPYRNKRMFDCLTSILNSSTALCVGFDITGNSESIETRSIGDWRKLPFEFSKRPCIFLFQAL